MPVIRRMGLTRTAWSVLAWAIQLAIAIVGLVGLVVDSTTVTLVWCVLASVYAAVTIAVLARQSGRRGWGAVSVQPPEWFLRIRGPVTVLLTLAATTIGVISALGVMVLGDEDAESVMLKLLGVWAMLLAWGFLHWGYAQLYEYRSQRALPERILDFPATPDPTLVDHVYFAYTLGTTFAASDVSVLDTRTRWLVTVHSVLAFFINALIIALAFSTLGVLGRILAGG